MLKAVLLVVTAQILQQESFCNGFLPVDVIEQEESEPVAMTHAVEAATPLSFTIVSTENDTISDSPNITKNQDIVEQKDSKPVALEAATSLSSTVDFNVNNQISNSSNITTNQDIAETKESEPVAISYALEAATSVISTVDSNVNNQISDSTNITRNQDIGEQKESEHAQSHGQNAVTEASSTVESTVNNMAWDSVSVTRTKMLMEDPLSDEDKDTMDFVTYVWFTAAILIFLYGFCFSQLPWSAIMFLYGRISKNDCA